MTKKIIFLSVMCIKALFMNMLYAQQFTEQMSLNTPEMSNLKVECGDFNNDGNMDFLLAGYSGNTTTIRIYQSNGSILTEIPITDFTLNNLVVGDYDNDGDLDILIGKDTNVFSPEFGGIYRPSTSMKIYNNNGNGFFSIKKEFLLDVTGDFLDLADYDNDGDLDISISGYHFDNSYPIHFLYKNNGDGNFLEDVHFYSNFGDIVWGDYDSDGDLDNLVYGNYAMHSVYSYFSQNNRNGSFLDNGGIYTGYADWLDVDWGDYDNDGYLDYLISNLGGDAYMFSSDLPTFYIFKNNGNFSFSQAVASKSMAGGFLDYDNDGDLDIFSTSKVFKNNGNDIFVEQDDTPIPYSGTCLPCDFDNDGDLDILVYNANYNGPSTIKLYTNNSENINTKPNIITNLLETVNGNEVIFNWDDATDPNQTGGLNYNLYVYDVDNNKYIRPPHAFPQTDARNGKLIIAERGAIQTNTYQLTIPAGNYKWSVQAIDASLSGGNFADEKSFVVAGDAFFIVSANTLTIGYNAGNQQVFNILSNVQWTLQSDQGWLSPNQTAGAGNATIVLTATKNPNLTTRTATITLSAIGFENKTITVTQNGIPLSLTISTTSFTILATENSIETFNITSNTSWTITSSESWLAPNVASGSGNATITLTASANTAFTSRNATITVFGSGVTDKTIAVTQNGVTPVLNVSNTSLTISAPENSTKTFDITSNTNWSISSSENWLNASVTSGSGNSTITLTAKENTSTNSRNATITVSANDVPDKTITVTQEVASPVLEISATTLIISAPEKSTKTFDIISNINWNVASSETWLSANVNFGSGNTTITLTATANPTFSTRNATITVSGNGVTNKTITVTQDGAIPVLDISVTALTISAPANSTKTFDITSNTSWNISSSQTWLNPNVSNGSGNTTITLTASQNPTIETRMATITISGNGVPDKTIAVTQEGAALVLNISTAALTISAPANSTKTFDITSNTTWTVSSSDTWLSSNKSNGSGNSTITLTATKNPSTETRTATITVSGIGVSDKLITVTQDASATAIEELTQDEFSVYPNPVHDILYLKTKIKSGLISIYDINIKEILKLKNNSNQINISSLMNGVYTLKIRDKRKIAVVRFVKE